MERMCLVVTCAAVLSAAAPLPLSQPSQPVRTIVVSVEEAEMVACNCTATTGHMVNTPVDHNSVPGCTATTVPYLYVTTTAGPAGSSCRVQGAGCEDEGKKCTATVKCELKWPGSPLVPCITSGGVTGPGIGTTEDPCQPAVVPNSPSCTWNMIAGCIPQTGGVTGEGVGTMKFHVAGCSHGQPVAGVTAEYRPKLMCSECGGGH